MKKKREKYTGRINFWWDIAFARSYGDASTPVGKFLWWRWDRELWELEISWDRDSVNTLHGLWFRLYTPFFFMGAYT